MSSMISAQNIKWILRGFDKESLKSQIVFRDQNKMYISSACCYL